MNRLKEMNFNNLPKKEEKPTKSTEDDNFLVEKKSAGLSTEPIKEETNIFTSRLKERLNSIGTEENIKDELNNIFNKTIEKGKLTLTDYRQLFSLIRQAEDRLRIKINNILTTDDYNQFEKYINNGFTKKTTENKSINNNKLILNKLHNLYLSSFIQIPHKIPENKQIKELLQTSISRQKMLVLDGYGDLIAGYYYRGMKNEIDINKIAQDLLSFFKKDLTGVKNNPNLEAVLIYLSRLFEILANNETKLQADSNKNKIATQSQESSNDKDLFLKKEKLEIVNYFLKLLKEKNTIVNSISESTLSGILSLLPDYSAQGLLSLIKNNEDKNQIKKISSILYRLEFGQIGISKEGVKYLEKIYDLGEYNNPDYHVSRLTPEGEVGIFNEEKELIKYIQLGDLSSPEKKIQAEVLDFTYETLFIGKENETPQQREQRLKYLKEFKQNYYRIANNKIFEQTGVRLNNLSFKEQGWFIIYFHEASGEEKEKLAQFVAQYGEVGIKTFLAMENDEKNGAKILKIGNSLDKQVAENIFKKFNNLSTLIKQSNEDLSKHFFTNDKTVEPSQEILKRASKVLVDYEKKIDKLNYDNLSFEEKTKINKNLSLELSNIKKDAIFFASMFKTAYKGKRKIDFNEVKGLDYQSAAAKKLTETDKKEIEQIIELNYKDNPEMIKFIQQELGRAFNGQSDVKFNLLRKNGKIIAFIRFEKQGKQELKAASFNVHPAYRGSAIGEAMLQNSMDIEAKNNKIKAIADVAKAVTYKYINQGGFIVTGFKEYKVGSTLHFNILRDDKDNPRYDGQNKKISTEQLLKQIPILKEPDYTKEKFLLAIDDKDKDEIKNKKLDEIIKNNHYYLTKIINNKYYLFERPLDKGGLTLAA